MAKGRGLKEQLLAWLTKWFVRLRYRASIEEQSIYETEGESSSVYLFSGERAPLGQSTPFSTIILNTHYLENLSESTRDYIFLHERSHNTRHGLWAGVLYGSVIWVSIGLSGIMVAMLATTLSGELPSTGPVLALGGFTAISIAFLIITNRIEELLADLSALRKIGEDRYLEATEEIDKLRDRSLTDQTLVKLMYFDPETVVKINRRMS